MTARALSDRLFLALIAAALVPATLPAAAPPPLPTRAALEAAVARSLPLVEKGAKGSMEHAPQCFTCHNQGVPRLALTTAWERGFAVDARHLEEQSKFIADFLDKNRKNYRAGKGTGGQADTAGYALWTLGIAGWQPDETTEAVVEYLLLFDKSRNHWQSRSRRPPSEQSPFTTTYLALAGLKLYATADQKDRAERRTRQVREWLRKSVALDTEDRVFRLRGLAVAGAPKEDVRRATLELLRTQRPDGGWSQLSGLDSDAYATGSALVALHQAGGLATDHPAYRAGLRYLLRSQAEDGSWYVKSRSKPFQRYFESGYPHGKDQFISITAAGWATTALALAVPAPPARAR